MLVENEYGKTCFTSKHTDIPVSLIFLSEDVELFKKLFPNKNTSCVLWFA